jgi:hypothetical protein
MGPAPLDPAQIEQKVIAYFEKYFVQYAAEFERQRGYAAQWFPPPLHWESSGQFTTWRETSLPHVVAVFAGTLDGMHRHGDGQHDALVMITMVIVCGANDRASSRALSQGYGAILSWIGAEAGDAETNFIREINVIDVDYTQEDDNATVATAAISFSVDIFGFLFDQGGPVDTDPPDDPYTDPPEELPFIDTAILDIELKEIP